MSDIIYQEKLLYSKILWQRPVHYYKAEGGKIMVLAGSKNMTGTAILTCEAIFRSGTGVLVLGYPSSLKRVYKDFMPEAMMLELPETPGHTLARSARDLILENARSCDVVVIGPGLSQNAETIQLVWEIVNELEKPIILDADGLAALTMGIGVIKSKEDDKFLANYFKQRKSELIITAHTGEAVKLCSALKLDKKFNNKYIEGHKPEIAEILAEKLHCTIVLKGVDATIATLSGKIIVNRLGELQGATEGSGDVLSSIIGSFVGQNPTKHFEAIVTAMYLHGLAERLAKENTGGGPVTASGIIKYLPEAIKKAEAE